MKRGGDNLLNKRGALELSIGTVVVVVIAMTMLVLGLVLVRTIFRGTTESVDSINEQVKKQINDLFSQENKKITVSLGSQHTASVRQGTDNFGIVIGFSPTNPADWGTDNTGCKYDISAQTFADTTVSEANCMATLNNNEANALKWILTGDSSVQFDEIDTGAGYSLIKMNIPLNVPPCRQRFYITAYCGSLNSRSDSVQTFFDIEIVKKGVFG
mgnify:CR=1 FL=1